ncbi:WD40-repeat-containing domain protein [Suillus paluster]|uniref:WD40-repeat-containing domain protein n=1 Tax=Suillus paluster TaxID=48578 RepID=UPI001B86AE23|nr:WD40-repeat-containing domain protein [Suillus paluster]KAG1732389.1 WD40-repeat-containing domain protein [Suillus paluster]
MASRYPAKPTLEEASTLAQSERPSPKHEFEGHKNAIQAFVFLHDDVHVVSASGDGTLRKWNCDTGLPVGKPWKGEGGIIYTLALSPNGKTIACGREDGSVQQWSTHGEFIKGAWMGHSGGVRSLSWSPSGGQLASGYSNGTILIRNAEGGEVELRLEQDTLDRVFTLAYSPSGDRIASGGSDGICIWDSKTGEPVIRPISDSELIGVNIVTSLVWSSDSSKLYSTSDNFARVLDSSSGKVLHRFKHDNINLNHLSSVALSPKHNVLAYVGHQGIAQLWDTVSHKPLCEDHKDLRCVSFSPDGTYLAYGGDNNTLTLWMVKDIVPKLPGPIPQQDHRQGTPEQGTEPESPSSSSHLDADATGGDGIIEEVHDDPYDNFFQSSQKSLPLGSSSPHLSSARRFWNTISRHRLPANESTPEERPKRSFFTRRGRTNSSLEPAAMEHNQPIPKAKVLAGEGDEGGEIDDSSKKCKGKQREEFLAEAQSPPHDNPAPPAEFDSEENRNLWKRLMRARGKDTTPAEMAPEKLRRPEVIEVYAVRGFQGIVALTPKRKKKSTAVTCSAPLVEGPSSQMVCVQARLSSQAMVGNGAQYSQATGGSSSLTSPSQFVTTYPPTRQDSDSDSIQGSCNKFLDKICFPRGHFHDD